MSYGDFGRVAPQKPVSPALRSGASSGCVVATVLACAGTGVLFFGLLSCGLIGFLFYRAGEAARAEQAARVDFDARWPSPDFPKIEPMRFEPPPPMEMPAFEPRPMPTFEPPQMPPMPEFPEPPTMPAPEFPGPGETFGPRFGPSFEPRRIDVPAFEPPPMPSFEPPAPFSSSSAAQTLEVVPVSFSSSKEDALPAATRLAFAPTRDAPPSRAGESDSLLDEARRRSAVVQAATHDIAAAAPHVAWLAVRRESLPVELEEEVAQAIEECLANADGAVTVRHVPVLLAWYQADDLPALVSLMRRQRVFADAETADISRRQILVGSFHRYVTLDSNWSHAAAPDLLRVLAESTTLSAQLIPAILELPTPFPAPMQNLFVELAFDDSTVAMVVQRRAMTTPESRRRLIDAAVARLESASETEREAAYMVLSSTHACPECRSDVISAIAHAFANESVEPSPAAHAALARWVDRDTAAQFRDFRDSASPVTRFAARATLDRYAIGP